MKLGENTTGTCKTIKSDFDMKSSEELSIGLNVSEIVNSRRPISERSSTSRNDDVVMIMTCEKVLDHRILTMQTNIR